MEPSKSAKAGRPFDGELSELVARLWEHDANRCQPGVHYTIDPQGRIDDTKTTKTDNAADKLFSFFDEEAVFSIPTFHWFRQLLDNYELSTGKPEVETSEELEESNRFLDAIMETKVMQEAHEFLVKLQKSPADKSEFKQQLYDLWFKLYKRSKHDKKSNSCGFEHVFVGETKGKQILGLHNWISFYLLEKSGTINYNGYIAGVEQSEQRLLTIQFTFSGGEGKPIGGSFIGVSPEFEFAFYTVCFLVKRGNTLRVRFAGMEVEVTVYATLGDAIATAYASDISVKH